MKALRYVLSGLLVTAVVALLCYQGFVQENLTSGNLTRGLLIIAASIASLLKKPRQRPVANKKALYQKAYPEFIQEPFSEDPKLEAKFYNAVHDYNRNKPSAAIEKLEALRKECHRTSDLRAVAVFTALCLDDLKRYDEALMHYQAARNIRDCSTLAGNMGLCCYRMGNFEKAEGYYKEAILLDSRNAYAYNNWSTLFFAQGDYEQALGKARDAISCNEKMPQALSTAAICCKLLAMEEEYTAYYRRAVAAGYDGEKIKQVIKMLDSDL